MYLKCMYLIKCSYPKNTGDILLVSMNDIRLQNRAGRKLFIPAQDRESSAIYWNISWHIWLQYLSITFERTPRSPHVDDLVNNDTRLGTFPFSKLIQEEFEVTNHCPDPLPTPFHPCGLWHLEKTVKSSFQGSQNKLWLIVYRQMNNNGKGSRQCV